jgi:hypothetical protein
VTARRPFTGITVSPPPSGTIAPASVQAMPPALRPLTSTPSTCSGTVLLALPPDHRVEHPRLDRGQHLRRERAETAHVGRAVARGPVPVQLRLLGRLVLSETDTGVWLQLEGETSEEWGRLDALAAAGIWTCGPGTDDVLARLRALAADIAPGFGHVWGGASR